MKRRWTAMAVGLVAAATSTLHAASPLQPAEQDRVDRAVDRALEWLAEQQAPDGSFASVPHGQPGVTALCAMAFLGRGDLPSEGPRSELLRRAIAYTLSCQKSDGGLINVVPDAIKPVRRVNASAQYNHALGALLLTEAYGMTTPDEARRLKPVIERAIAFTLRRNPQPKRDKREVGGWRYYVIEPGDELSDLSVTSWQLIFLRSAKNAGFEVPTHVIDEGITYVLSCYNARRRAFFYLNRSDYHPTRAMSGAGVLTLSMAGLHDTPEARACGEEILDYDFTRYNENLFLEGRTPSDRYHYGAFYCTLATHQLGGRYFDDFFPRITDILLRHQAPDGSWAADTRDAVYGNAYITALMVMALTAPDSMLPVFQR